MPLPQLHRPTSRRSARPSLAATFAVGLALSCAPGAARDVALADSAANTAAARPLAWSFEAPARWDERIRIEEGSAPTIGGARAVRAFAFAPDDTTTRAEPILYIAVYDTAVWRAARDTAGAALGDTLATVGNQVFVASLARSNPYPSNNRAARAFDSLAVTIDEVRRSFRILR